MANLADELVSSHLKIRQLVLLAHLDEYRSVFRAANASHMTQSAASKLLGQIEDAMGVELFVRHARGVYPTSFGEIVVQHARSALMELRLAREEVSALKSGLSGQVAIGTVVISGMNIVPKAVAGFKKRFPHVLVNIELDYSEALLPRLEAGKLDIVIARMHHNAKALSDFHYQWLNESSYAIVARAEHPLARKRGLDWPDLVQQTWVLPPEGNLLRDQLELLIVKQNLPLPKQVVETPSLPIITRLLQMSDMIAPLAKDVVRPYCAPSMLRLLPIRLDLRLGPSAIITRRTLSPSASAMLSVLRQVAGVER